VTFSILGRCDATGRLGMAVTSSSPAVAARCANVRAQVGVAASQNITDPRLGPALLDALAAGRSPHEAVRSTVTAAAHADYRQLAIVGADGAGAAWSGPLTLGIHGARTGGGWATAGNLLASESVLDAVARAFTESAKPELEARLLAALAAGLAAGGEAGPLHSAGLLVADAVAWPVTDLRVDWADEDDGPIERLAALWERWAPQRDDYVNRALHPDSAPAYGVPGDPGPDDGS
jgi:uncharacterized Ntn-hydrolase superfamily protein